MYSKDVMSDDSISTTTTTMSSWQLHTLSNEANLSVGTILWASVIAIIFAWIMAGNILTVVSVRICRRLRSIISNQFILSLAISDIVIGLMLPYHLAFYMGTSLGKSHDLCLLRFIMLIFPCCVSVLTLISIAIDRYIAIFYPLHYRCYMTRRVAYTIIAFSWIMGALVGVVPIFWNHWGIADECEFNEILPSWYIAGILTPGFALIWILMLLIYWRIMREASKHACQLRRTKLETPAVTILSSNWKSVQVVVFITGCFSICWLPYFVVACAQIFYIRTDSTLVYKTALTLAFLNSAFNPLIYAWKNTNFRNAFVQLLRCKNPNSCTEYEPSHDAQRNSLPYRQDSVYSIDTTTTTPASITTLALARK